MATENKGLTYGSGTGLCNPFPFFSLEKEEAVPVLTAEVCSKTELLPTE